MSSPTIFLDSSALFAGALSAEGAARALILAGVGGELAIVVSRLVILETERALARKRPEALPYCRETIRSFRIVPDPAESELRQHHGSIRHDADLPILVAAVQASVDYLATLNRRHFIDDPQVAERSGLRIGTPGDALAWLREALWGASVQ